jgi:hypothetical protein
MDNNVSFDEIRTRITYQGPPTPKIITLFMRLSRGRIKDEKTAGTILAALAILTILISVALFTNGNDGADPELRRELHPPGR